ncbi:hypothetical protein [Streptomyces sp. MZ04]|uniref:hypothetical protein n=1 Tax=Streptomyces sp. MZ04 TaxID=2559236 RepID=UPI0014328511|nr:hypothetical protein [Streptomyces sp. MZ04]
MKITPCRPRAERLCPIWSASVLLLGNSPHPMRVAPAERIEVAGIRPERVPPKDLATPEPPDAECLLLYDALTSRWAWPGAHAFPGLYWATG